MGVSHFETSAKTKLNVTEVFTQVARDILVAKEKGGEGEGEKGTKTKGRGCILL